MKIHTTDSHIGNQFGRLRIALNVFLIAVFVALISAVLGGSALSAFNTDLPDLIGVGKTKSSLEGRDYKKFPSLSLSSIKKGKFQTDVEAWAADHVPHRDGVLLANAALQRQGIVTANLFTNWDCYPTFYGSKRIYVPASNSLMKIPSKNGSKIAAGLSEFVQQIEEFAKENPSITIVCYVVGADSHPAYCPAYNYVNKSFTYSDVIDTVESTRKEKSSNLNFLYTTYDSEAAYSEHFYKTDHHWNISGAYAAYSQIVDKLGIEPCDLGEIEAVGNGMFYGSFSRGALYPIYDKTYDLANYPAISYMDDNGNEQSALAHTKYKNATQEAKKLNFHSLYFGDIKGKTLINETQSGATLLIADSFGEIMQRILASNFKETTYINDMHRKLKNKKKLRDIIGQFDANTVVFVGQPENYAFFTKKHSEYFK